MKSLLFLQLALLSSAAVVKYPNSGRSRGSSNSVFDILAEDNRFYDFLDVLSKERSLTDDLQDSKQEVTVFAPTNQAFEKLRNTYQGNLPREELRDAVRYHFIPEWLEYEDLREEKLIETQLRPRGLDGEYQKIRVVRREGHVVLNNLVSISEADLEARNGIVHAVDDVLLPPPKVTDLIFRMANKFSTFSAALQRTGLNDDFEREKGITAFVPTNSAFRKLGCRALNYLFGEEGEKDLRRILEFHFSPELVYGTEIEEQAGHRGGSKDRNRWNRGRRGGRDDDDDDYGRGRRRGGRRGSDWEEDRDLDSKVTPAFNLNYPRGSQGNRRGRSGYNDVTELPSFLRGEKIYLEVKKTPSRRVYINVNDEARVIFSDIPSENGVFHAIDQVLLPENLDIPDYDWFDNDDQCDF
ncbi:hypothetical protein K7432_011318 [Basidiobolus ranarum]|uniref:FAS1 domain-containing protein n=1 Tax=Basidiobolus ranarum TaxID=34480 RepID=A0ABR2VV22_9FUNG